MTNAVVWLDKDTSKVWCAADSLITALNPGLPRSSARRVTDQAMKIMRLSVGSWGHTKFSVADGPFLSYDMGMVYAGAVTPAVMTHAAVSMMVANLHPQTLTSERIYTPAFSRVAELVRYVSERYIKDAAIAHPQNPPLCEFVIFAMPPADDQLACGIVECYWIHPGTNGAGQFCQVIEQVDLLGGDFAVIGDDAIALRDDIVQMQCASAGELNALPRTALAMRIRAQKHHTVGGTLQFGVMENGSMGLFGAMEDAYGSPAKNWLGFECESEINPIMGMPVVIPSLD